MTELHIDIIEGAALTETESGYEAKRVYKVSGLTSGSASARQYQALNLPNMPRRGDSHPTIPDLTLDRRSAAAIKGSTGAVMVTLTYRSMDGADIVGGGRPTIEVTTALTTETTSRDAFGNQVVIVTTVPRLDEDGNQIGEDVERQVASFSKQVPMTTLRFHRKEDRDPLTNALAFVGKVGGWGAVGSPFWMCTHIGGPSGDGGRTWDVTYEFQAKRGTWRAPVEPIDPATGQPYIDGIVQFVPLYQEVDFTPLGLPQPDGLTPQSFT